jgi:hypothetical protein
VYSLAKTDGGISWQGKDGRYVASKPRNLRYSFGSVGGKHKTKFVHVSKESTTEVDLPLGWGVEGRTASMLMVFGRVSGQ